MTGEAVHRGRARLLVRRDWHRDGNGDYRPALAQKEPPATRGRFLTAVIVIAASLALAEGCTTTVSTPRNVTGTPISSASSTPPVPSASPTATTAQPLPSQTAIGTGANARAWAAAILKALSAPVTTANVNSLVGWFQKEDNGGQEGARADGIGENNPLSITAFTRGITGSSGSVTSGAGGPDNLTFPTVAAGVNAIREALAAYPLIRKALVSGAGLIGNPAVASELSLWSGGGYSSV